MNHTADIRSVRPGDAPQLAHIQTESWKPPFGRSSPLTSSPNIRTRSL